MQDDLKSASLDINKRGSEFVPHRRHCAVSLSKIVYPLLSTGSTQENPSRHNNISSRYATRIHHFYMLTCTEISARSKDSTFALNLCKNEGGLHG